MAEEKSVLIYCDDLMLKGNSLVLLLEQIIKTFNVSVNILEILMASGNKLKKLIRNYLLRKFATVDSCKAADV